MNVNSGGPHILLFERDQQLMALLTSEFQLAGYECHGARTAVEVFDAIARYPIRLVLVNLAQAAAGRREFWVALDAQRRGRGVQVFTFRCMNLAGYGSDDPDERARTALADMEVDGMLGVMNLVNAVRARIPGSTTGSFSRVGTTPSGNSQESGSNYRLNKSAEAVQPVAPTQSSLTAQVTMPLPTQQPPVGTPSLAASSQSHPAPTPSSPLGLQESPGAGLQGSNRSGNAPSTFTDKIRAVIYPSSRSFSPMPETNWGPHNQQNVAAAPRLVNATDTVAQPEMPQRSREVDRDLSLSREQMQQSNSTVTASTQVQPESVEPVDSQDAQPGALVSSRNTVTSIRPSSSQESGLDQLSRMLREHTVPAADQDEVTSSGIRVAMPPTPRYAQQQVISQAPSQAAQVSTGDGVADMRASQPVRPLDAAPISTLPLRASPIQDIPIEREPEYRGETASMQVPQQTRQPVASPSSAPLAATTIPVKAVPLTPQRIDVESAEQELKSLTFTDEKLTGSTTNQGSAGPDRDMVGVAPPGEDEAPLAGTRFPRLVSLSAGQGNLAPPEKEAGTTPDDMLLNIVQSLPPMSSLPAPSPQSQTPVLSGRATRSLGSVLLEGHLVPQHRLEVAQHIQRMLRGVDMNYQLGEILLMFKLLTPDQLLAASLVSYGLISTAQISALGRIRQELHSISLEYDLESLLVLFRILSPEQLREVRASWTG